MCRRVLFQRLSVHAVELGFSIQSAGVCLGEAEGGGLCWWVKCRAPALPLRGRVDSYVNSSLLPWMRTGQALAVVPRELLSVSPARQPGCPCAIHFPLQSPCRGPCPELTGHGQ